MRRFLAAVLSSSLPLLAAVPAQAGPSRQLQYAVVATSGGIARRATVVVDFVSGSAERVMNVNVDEIADGAVQQDAYIGIEPSSSLLGDVLGSLTTEEDAICSLMAMESEDLAAVSIGQHWERQGPVPGGHHHTRFSVLGVNDDGLVQFAVSRDLERNDGTVARWRGTMLYNANDFVPSTITLNGENIALSIRLVHDTFKHY
jgi:hypothetical protein